MDVKIGKKEIQGLKDLFRDQYQVLSVIESYERIFEVSETLEYPVKDFKDLISKAGDKEIQWLEPKIKISDLQSIIPDSYFPVVDQDDLLYKAQQLIKGLMVSAAPNPEVIPREKLPEFPPQLVNYKPSRSFPGFSMVRITDVK